LSLGVSRSAYVAGSRIPEVLLVLVFLFSLFASIYLGNYVLVFFAGLVTYTYMVLSGHVMVASVILLTSLPFQALVAGPQVVHVIAYYSLVLLVKSLVLLRRSCLTLASALVPPLIYLTLFHPVVEVPPLHYLLICCVALLAGYLMRVSEELIVFGSTSLEVSELDFSKFFRAEKFLSLLALSYVVTVLPTLLFLVFLSHGLVFTQSLLASLVAGFSIVVFWFLVRGTAPKLVLVLVSTVFAALVGGSLLLSVFEESLRLFEEVVGYFG